ncbi:hypothetical protein [Lelliottia wanjuensis]|uniref:hypothetical protein n=1 Tax=Lelliottia wanjuensis TaxID=3050585 RepID=UPI00254AD7F7|nr:hypothetical protein [Lelliottia sp. V106_16]MDK9356747.1 hypothetical protein [Lelliottia sp. V106_16]
MTFTKEQLIEKLEHRITVAAKYPDVEEAQFDAAIFKLALSALAGMEAEPVSYEHIRREVNVGGNTWVQCSKHAFDKAKTEGKIVRELYERPHPLTTSERAELENYRNAQPVALVEQSDFITTAQIVGEEPRTRAVRELFEGALIAGQKLYAVRSQRR